MKTYELRRSHSMNEIFDRTEHCGGKSHRLWERRGSAPTILSDVQLESIKNQNKAIDRINNLVADLGHLSKSISQESIYHSCEDISESEKYAKNNIGSSFDIDQTVHDAENSNVVLEMGIEEGNDQSVRESPESKTWVRWTAAIAAAKGVQGGISAFAGRLVEEGVRIGAGAPKTPEEVSDAMLAAGAAINLAVGLMEGVRAGMHTWRAQSRPSEYTRALRGLPPEDFIVGTPYVPASVIRRSMASIAVGAGVFTVAAHTGIIGLTQLGTQNHNKHNFYDALWESNGNAVYAYTRELTNAVIDGSGIGPRSTPLGPKGFAVTTGQYLLNSLGQRAAKDYLETGKRPEFDIRWPAISAATAIVDSAVTATAARFSSPIDKATFFRGSLSEGAKNDAPYKWPTIKDSADRIMLRGGARHLFDEVASVIPGEIGRPISKDAYTAFQWVASVAKSGSHVRDLVQQAEAAVIKASSSPRHDPLNRPRL
ncbi:hypothetical protein [Limnohabitans sp. 2KL-17]|uniref:hypothetical protein n=1 Tax=Limnohabitans sp. 2KL-17 TaxID=1100704 RepID=UPI0011B1F08E|nr:hypothetical protein [Limnohabitans sp. 2KL-17]